MSPKFKNPRARFNFQGRTCSISGVGSYVPARILTNADLEKMVGEGLITFRDVHVLRFLPEPKGN